MTKEHFKSRHIPICYNAAGANHWCHRENRAIYSISVTLSLVQLTLFLATYISAKGAASTQNSVVTVYCTPTLSHGPIKVSEKTE